MEQTDPKKVEGVEAETDHVEEPKSNTSPPVETHSMETLLEEQGLGLDFPKQGEIRSGVIATLGENEILVSVGTKSEGVISGRELEQIPDEERSLFK